MEGVRSEQVQKQSLIGHYIFYLLQKVKYKSLKGKLRIYVLNYHLLKVIGSFRRKMNNFIYIFFLNSSLKIMFFKIFSDFQNDYHVYAYVL
jgi:hypothetical protein